VDLRASARYLAAFAVILGGVGLAFSGVDASIKAIGLEGANIAFGFLFGQRIVTGFKK